MFGHVCPSLQDLSEQEKARYKAVYCGLCHTLGERYGFPGKMTLTYDFTFLTFFLGSLYETEESYLQTGCMIHPIKKHEECTTQITAYAADMTIALAYFKCQDDWQDDHELKGKIAADVLEKSYQKVKLLWPEQCRTIEKQIKIINASENENTVPDQAAAAFGDILGSIFAWKHDFWENAVREFGKSLGMFIYMIDAAVDYEEDEKHKRFNSLRQLNVTPADAKPLLMQLLGVASQIFESLPLIRDDHLMRNILYSGVWQHFNEKTGGKEKAKDDRRSVQGAGR